MRPLAALVDYGVLADSVFLVHLGFILFVALGGALVAWRRRAAWFHVPAALYGAAIEFFGWTCPLTPIEIRLRLRSGEEGYGGGFVDEYLRGIVYPESWADIHVWLGMAVVAGNGLIYWWIWRRRAIS